MWSGGPDRKQRREGRKKRERVVWASSSRVRGPSLHASGAKQQKRGRNAGIVHVLLVWSGVSVHDMLWAAFQMSYA